MPGAREQRGEKCRRIGHSTVEQPRDVAAQVRFAGRGIERRQPFGARHDAVGPVGIDEPSSRTLKNERPDPLSATRPNTAPQA